MQLATTFTDAIQYIHTYMNMEKDFCRASHILFEHCILHRRTITTLHVTSGFTKSLHSTYMQACYHSDWLSTNI